MKFYRNGRNACGCKFIGKVYAKCQREGKMENVSGGTKNEEEEEK